MIGRIRMGGARAARRDLLLALALAVLAAAVGFVGAARKSQDGLLPWMAAFCAMAAAARVAYAVEPMQSGDVVAAADVLRLGSYVLLLAGGARQIGAFWARAVSAATL